MAQRYLRVFTLCLIIVGICAVLSIPAGASFPSQQIAYVARTNSNGITYTNLMVYDVPHQLYMAVEGFRTRGHISDSDWSPDGRYLAYVANRSANFDEPENNQLHIFDMETSAHILTLDTGSSSSWYAEWSYSGQYIALEADNTFMIVDVERGEIINTLNTPEDGAIVRAKTNNFQWALDDRGLVLFGTYQGEDGIYNIDIETHAVTQLYTDENIYDALGFIPEYIQHMLWSPDYSALAIVADSALYIFDPTTNEAILLTPSEINILFPKWSDDSRQLTFTHDNNDYPSETALYTINRDGTNLNRIITSTIAGTLYWGASIRPH